MRNRQQLAGLLNNLLARAHEEYCANESTQATYKSPNRNNMICVQRPAVPITTTATAPILLILVILLSGFDGKANHQRQCSAFVVGPSRSTSTSLSPVRLFSQSSIPSLDTVLSQTDDNESNNDDTPDDVTSAAADISADGPPIENNDEGTSTDHITSASAADTAAKDSLPIVNGSNDDTSAALPSSPPLTFEKYVTMQGKRVPVEIHYSGQSGLRPFFLTVAKKIKDSYPDVMVEKLILPNAPELEPSFEVLVDGKVVIGKTETKRQSIRRSGGSDHAGGLSVFVDMEEIDQAIEKARRKRRPNTTVYAQKETEDARAIRLEVLRKQSLGEEYNASWND